MCNVQRIVHSASGSFSFPQPFRHSPSQSDNQSFSHWVGSTDPLASKRGGSADTLASHAGGLLTPWPHTREVR